MKQKGERIGNKLPVPRYIIQEVLQRNRKCDNFGLPCYMNYRGIAHAGSDGTRRRTGGEVKGKDANGVGSQSSCIHTPHSSTASS